jgi:5-formyltetrahydrofolate cyclo-ligase
LERRTIDLLEGHSASGFHAFLPILRNREPDTFGIIKHFFDRGKNVLISRSNFEDHSMTHFRYDEKLDLVKNKFDIPEPVGGTVCQLSEVNWILVPLLAADQYGNRLGYGKGFYDRLLGEADHEIMKVGLNIGPLFDRFPFAESHDIRLDYCITPFETKKYS